MERIAVLFHLSIFVWILLKTPVDTYILKGERNRAGVRIHNLKNNIEKTINKGILESDVELGQRDERKMIPSWKEAVVEYLKKAIAGKEYQPKEKHEHLERGTGQNGRSWPCIWCETAKIERPLGDEPDEVVDEVPDEGAENKCSGNGKKCKSQSGNTNKNDY